MQVTPKSLTKPKTDNKCSQIGTKSSKINQKPLQMTHLPQNNPITITTSKNLNNIHTNSSHHSSPTSSHSNSSNSNSSSPPYLSSEQQQHQHTKSTLNLIEESYDSLINSIMQSKRNCSSDDISGSISAEHSERQLGPPQHSTQSQKMRKAFMRQQSISPIEIINQHSEEVKALSNCVEIEDFYDYTKTCMKMIVNISHINYTPPAKVTFPFKGDKKRLAVFDLDETLVHCLVKDYDNETTNIIEVPLPSKQTAKIGVMIRPHWEKAIKRIMKYYHVVIYTASHKSYADAVLNFLDPDNKFFPYRLYRNNCIMLKHEGQVIYVKDCSIFEDYDLKDMVLVDNSVLSFAYHLDNGIPITPYYNATKDFELLFCACYLENIRDYEDLRERNRELLKLDQYVLQALDELKQEEEKKERKMLKKKEKEKEYHHGKNHAHVHHVKKRKSKQNIEPCTEIKEEDEEMADTKRKKRRDSNVVSNNDNNGNSKSNGNDNHNSNSNGKEEEIPSIGRIGFKKKKSNFCNDFEYDLLKLRTKFSDNDQEYEENGNENE